MKRYQVTITGVTALLMHADDVKWADKMKEWEQDPGNKKRSVAGDDRWPAYRWLGYVYKDPVNDRVGIPSDNIMTALREGGAMVPSGQKQGAKTLKAMSQSGLLVDEVLWPIIIDGKELTWKPFMAMIGNDDFEAQEQMAKDNGFELFCKRAKVGTSKHVRVRPRFDRWQCSGTITVIDPSITRQKFEQILEYAGSLKGLCDWRPSSKQSPGHFGKFESEIQEL